MIYAREPLDCDTAPGVFIYAAAVEGSNKFQFGLGVESVNGLQRKHVSPGLVHEANVDYMIEQIKGGSEKQWATKSLKEHFYSGQDYYHLTNKDRNSLVKVLRKIKDGAFSAAKTMRRVWIDEEGRYLFAGYDKTNDRIRVGIARVTDGIQQLGTAVRYDRKNAYENAANMYRDWAGYGFSMPANWGMPGRVYAPCNRHLKAVAVEIVRIADAVWK